MTPSELTVTVKDEEKSFKQKFLLYKPYSVDPHDETVQECIQEAISNSKIIPEDIKIRINMEVK